MSKLSITTPNVLERFSNLRPFNKILIGAILLDVESNEKIIKLWTGGTNNDEYFLLEYRKKKGFDANWPNEGLLIYHIDDTKLSNSDEGHYLVGVEQADGKQDLETKRNSGGCRRSISRFTK